MTTTTATRGKKIQLTEHIVWHGKGANGFFPSTTQRRNVLRSISGNMQRRRFNCKPFYTQFVRVTANSQPFCIWHLFTVEVLPSSLQPMMMRSYPAHSERKVCLVSCRFHFEFTLSALIIDNAFTTSALRGYRILSAQTISTFHKIDHLSVSINHFMTISLFDLFSAAILIWFIKNMIFWEKIGNRMNYQNKRRI